MTREETSPRVDDTTTDELLRELGDRPMSPPVQLHTAARAAFVRSFEPVRWYQPVVSVFARATLPVALVGIVVVYLSWAFATASSLMQ